MRAQSRAARWPTFAAHGGPAGLHGRDPLAGADSGRLLEACDGRGAVPQRPRTRATCSRTDRGLAVTGFVDLENVIAADPLLDLAKTLQYDADRSPDKRAALLAGYGPLPPDADARLDLYRLFHSLDSWRLSRPPGTPARCRRSRADLRELAG